MIKITIEGDEDLETLELMFNHLCYAITDESGIELKAEGWDGHSGGDDAYFGLMDKKVEVEVK